ncbi:MAG: response regulator transcription factor [Acidimicrobiia bacterium]|nr:response regulator transcription factor [Acidimicrobiia bacterium]MDH4306273.1 response regulator transcription factor [Acidimicrobiia bacterium]MDH5292261.1 response regulator transcription factor [Acidimicrobiia bacterium]
MRIRVVVVDDQELVRAGFAMILDNQPDMEVVGQAADGIEAIASARSLRPDVMLMDIRMPRMDGIEATRAITSLDTALPIRVVVLTTFQDDEYVYAALEAGASGFVLKDLSPGELVHAVRVAAKGDALLAPAVTRMLIQRVVSERPIDRQMQERIKLLTDREREVLLWVARGLTNAEIGESVFIGEATVKSHVSHILTKLGARDRVHAVAIAYEAGFIPPGLNDP